MQVRAIVEEDDDVKIHLHDTVNWVSAKLSKSLRDHVKAGVFEVGDIVEVIVTLRGLAGVTGSYRGLAGTFQI